MAQMNVGVSSIKTEKKFVEKKFDFVFICLVKQLCLFFAFIERRWTVYKKYWVNKEEKKWSYVSCGICQTKDRLQSIEVNVLFKADEKKAYAIKPNIFDVNRKIMFFESVCYLKKLANDVDYV